MDKKNIIVSATLTLLIGGCANMNYKQQAALKGAAAGTIIGGGIGGGAAALTDGKNRFAIATGEAKAAPTTSAPASTEGGEDDPSR